MEVVMGGRSRNLQFGSSGLGFRGLGVLGFLGFRGFRVFRVV